MRNPTAPVASQVNVPLSALLGDWIVVEGAGIEAGGDIRIDSQDIYIEGQSEKYSYDGAGRFRTDDGPLWVYWIDVGYRTVAMGDPQGTRVWIMDRQASGSPDRLRAAREILQWYGYDLTRLEGA
ncbi:lipocalin family protein [Mesobacterium sp. TK19101]|uniref:Lipocalin family protein n=1 Tax=Mesobacterium hydrothermale TaxID=3111907 RepID=A0ABU6HDQ3_9RHOB|nr:lipocalin family protein [Mesobacterium sp. TK19101]MEC3860587.1 lipocalin family protein [Mesobacterium sp. TK19101]